MDKCPQSPQALVGNGQSCVHSGIPCGHSGHLCGHSGKPCGHPQFFTMSASCPQSLCGHLGYGIPITNKHVRSVTLHKHYHYQHGNKVLRCFCHHLMLLFARQMNTFLMEKSLSTISFYTFIFQYLQNSNFIKKVVFFTKIADILVKEGKKHASGVRTMSTLS